MAGTVRDGPFGTALLYVAFGLVIFWTMSVFEGLLQLAAVIDLSLVLALLTTDSVPFR